MHISYIFRGTKHETLQIDRPQPLSRAATMVDRTLTCATDMYCGTSYSTFQTTIRQRPTGLPDFPSAMGAIKPCHAFWGLISC